MSARYFLYFATIVAAARAFGQSPNSIFINADIAGDQKLAAQGNVTAAARLGHRFLTGSAGTIDGVQAYNYLVQAAPKWAAASAYLGYASIIRPELASKSLNGVALVQQASNAGDPVGTTLLGRLYHLGKGVPQNTATARALYTQAAPKFALAYTFLGETYLGSITAGDHSKAVPYFLSGAAAGDTQSMVQLGLMYFRGDGISQDYSQAARWFGKAAELGDPPGTYQQGLLYFKGQGSQRSQIQAVALYTRAALAGYAPAEADLGVCYAKGQGVTKDINKAIYWLGLAAPTFPYAAAQLALVMSGKPLN